MSDTEETIQKLGLSAPRVTPGHIDKTIVDASYHKLTETLTVCVLTLTNGFTVTGESACASPENFNEELGQTIAHANAREKVWGLEGYLLKQRMYEA